MASEPIALTAEWLADVDGLGQMSHACPGCGVVSTIACNEHGGERGWELHGSRAVPTLFPSLIKRCCNTEWVLKGGVWYPASEWTQGWVTGEHAASVQDAANQPLPGFPVWKEAAP